MDNSIFEGSGTAVIAPMNEDGSINYKKMVELIEQLFSDINPIPVRTAMNLMGLNAGPCRFPLYRMSADKEAALKEYRKKYQLNR